MANWTEKARGLLHRARLVRPLLTIWVQPSVAPLPPDATGLNRLLDHLRAVPDPRIRVHVHTGGVDDRTHVVAQRHAGEDWRVVTVVGKEVTVTDLIAATTGQYILVIPPLTHPPASAISITLAQLEQHQPEWALGPGPAHLNTGAVWSRAALRRLPTHAPLTELMAHSLHYLGAPAALEAPLLTPHRPSRVHGFPDARPLLAQWQHQLGLTPKLSPAARAQWAGGQLAAAGVIFADIERYSHSEWHDLVTTTATLAQLTTEATWSQIPVVERTLAWLISRGLRDDALRLVAWLEPRSYQFGTTTEGDAVVAQFPLPILSPQLRTLSPAETRLCSQARGLRVVDDQLEIVIFAAIAGVDLRDTRPSFSAAAVAAMGLRVPARVQVAADPAVTRWMGTRFTNHDWGKLTLQLPLAQLEQAQHWQLQLHAQVAGVSRSAIVSQQVEGSSTVFRAVSTGANWLGVTSPQFGLQLGVAPSVIPDGPVITSIEVTDQLLRVHTAEPELLRLSGPVELAREDGAEEVTWSLHHDPWRLGARPAPSGRYLIEVTGTQPVAVTGSLADKLPYTVTTDHHRADIRLCPGPTGEQIVVELGPPLSDAELGPFQQQTMAERYTVSQRPLDPNLVYFQAYTGASATDSPLAIALELRRRHPQLRHAWLVADGSSYYPAGAEPVLWGSQHWYDTLAQASHIVTNIELEPWFVRRRGQQVVQTFHGYPSKLMGKGLWESQLMPQWRQEQLLDRTSRNWSLLLTPMETMDEYYRREYHYAGQIAAVGYPRTDPLVQLTARHQQQVRHRLGVEAGQTVVLYAPTWRDSAMERFRAGAAIDFLDVPQTARELGPGYTILWRGHRFMAPVKLPRLTSEAAQIIDVSSYPEINDLIAVADVAVLDYSSIRFELALAQVPMVFLVPDLDTYAGVERGFLFPFSQTAPGPLLRDRGAVVHAIGRRDQLRDEYAQVYAEFNRNYNRLHDGNAAARVVQQMFIDPSDSPETN